MASASAERHPSPHQHHSHHHHQSHHSVMHPKDRDHERDVHGLRMALGSILSPKRMPSSRASSSGTASPVPTHFGPGLVHPYPHHSSESPHPHPHSPHVPSSLHTPGDVVHHAYLPEGGVDDSHHREGGGLLAPPMDSSRPSLAFTRSHSQSSIASTDDESDSGDSHPPSTSTSANAVPTIFTTTNGAIASSPSSSSPAVVEHSEHRSLASGDSNASTTGEPLTDAEKKKMVHQQRKLAKQQLQQQTAAIADEREREREERERWAEISSALQSKRAWDVLVHGSMA